MKVTISKQILLYCETDYEMYSTHRRTRVCHLCCL